MLYLSLVVSVILLVVVNWMARRAEQRVGQIIVCAIVIGLFSTGICFFTLPPVLLQAVLVCIAALIWGARRGTPRSFLALSCLATVLAFAIPGYFAFRSTKHMQQAYPYTSMDERLPPPKKHPSSEVLPVASADRLAEMEALIDDNAERKGPGTDRIAFLRQIHEETVEVFVNRPGFGVTRATGLREHLLRQGDRQPFPQPGAPSASPWLKEQLQEEPSASRFTQYPGRLFSLHRDSVVDFVNLPGFGYFKDRQHVAGFVEHQVRHSPMDGWGCMLQRLDLIGLVLHEKPTAYVSENLPSMKELRAAPTRDLDEFESAGLLTLEHGEDLFIRERGQERCMLGAIRAMRQCLACHEAERGDLLGAFSYRITIAGK